MRRIKIAALMLCLAMLSVCFFACADTPTIEISDDGYWIINGEKTDVKAEGVDGKDGVDGQGGTAENPYELDFYPQDDGTYAVATGKAELLSKIEIPATYKGKPVTAIKGNGFSGCTNLASITIPDSVTSIGDDAFSACSSLMSIVIPDSVTSIGDAAFFRCSSLTSIIIPDGVTSIGKGAFNGCISLTSIEIPDSVTSIGSLAFYKCSSLTSIEFRGAKAQWNAISKEYEWNDNTGNYTVHCTDGDIAK